MKLCQILNNKVHWIFESEDMPQFAPDIIIKDITNLETQPQEGWDYNSVTEVYSPPAIIQPSTQPTEIEILKTQLKDALNAISILTNSSSDFVDYMFESIPDLPQ